MHHLHPSVAIIKNEMKRGMHTYAIVAEATKISEQRLKNMMTGRTEMTLEDRDAICAYLHLSPVNIVVRRRDLKNNKDYLDITVLPEGLRSSLFTLYRELVKLAHTS